MNEKSSRRLARAWCAPKRYCLIPIAYWFLLVVTLVVSSAGTNESKNAVSFPLTQNPARYLLSSKIEIIPVRHSAITIAIPTRICPTVTLSVRILTEITPMSSMTRTNPIQNSATEKSIVARIIVGIPLIWTYSWKK